MSPTLSISDTLCLCKIRQKASSHPRDIYFMTKRTHNFICRGNQAHIKTSQCISTAVASSTVFFGLIWAWIETVTSSLHSCWRKKCDKNIIHIRRWCKQLILGILSSIENNHTFTCFKKIVEKTQRRHSKNCECEQLEVVFKGKFVSKKQRHKKG